LNSALAAAVHTTEKLERAVVVKESREARATGGAVT